MESVVLVIAVVLIVLGVTVRALLAKCTSMLKPPLRIQLVPVDGRSKGRFADRHRRELELLGFAPIGTYQVREIPGVTLVAFTQAFKGVCAVVYRHPLAGVFVDMCSMTEDDQGLTVTSAPAGGNLDQPPGRRKIYQPKASLRQLHDRLIAQRPAGRYRRFDASTFARVFEEEYAREMEWRRQRGGPTQEEVRREAHAMGIRSEKAIHMATEKLRRQYETQLPGAR